MKKLILLAGLFVSLSAQAQHLYKPFNLLTQIGLIDLTLGDTTYYSKSTLVVTRTSSTLLLQIYPSSTIATWTSVTISSFPAISLGAGRDTLIAWINPVYNNPCAIIGPTGPTGATGATGPSGGPPGPSGVTGATGATGAMGVTGPTGATGATGATGIYIGGTSDTLYITDGSYVPDTSQLNNVRSITTYITAWSQVDSNVYVDGEVDIQARSAGFVQWTLGLPITANPTYPSLKLHGEFTGYNTSLSGVILESSNSKGQFNYVATDTLKYFFKFHIAYVTRNYRPGKIVQAMQGAQGATGATGARGATGPTGVNGSQGVTGATGPQGLTGAQGVPGATGPLGPNGATGARGPTGATGSQGPTGLLPNGSAAGNTPYWNGVTWVVNSSNIYNNGANIGIGTTVPQAKLQVSGTAKFLYDSNYTKIDSGIYYTDPPSLFSYLQGFQFYNGYPVSFAKADSGMKHLSALQWGLQSFVVLNSSLNTPGWNYYINSSLNNGNRIDNGLFQHHTLRPSTTFQIETFVSDYADSTSGDCEMSVFDGVLGMDVADIQIFRPSRSPYMYFQLYDTATNYQRGFNLQCIRNNFYLTRNGVDTFTISKSISTTDDVTIIWHKLNAVLNGGTNGTVITNDGSGNGTWQAAVGHGATGSEPGTPYLGQFYFDTTLVKMKFWNGTVWALITSTP